MQYCKNPEKVLQYWNALLQYCNTESLCSSIIPCFVFFQDLVRAAEGTPRPHTVASDDLSAVLLISRKKFNKIQKQSRPNQKIFCCHTKIWYGNFMGLTSSSSIVDKWGTTKKFQAYTHRVVQHSYIWFWFTNVVKNLDVVILLEFTPMIIILAI